MDSSVGDSVKNIKVDRESEREREIDKIEKERGREIVYMRIRVKNWSPLFFLPFLYIKLERPT